MRQEFVLKMLDILQNRHPSCNKSLHRAFECLRFFHKLKIHLDALCCIVLVEDRQGEHQHVKREVLLSVLCATPVDRLYMLLVNKELGRAST